MPYIQCHVYNAVHTVPYIQCPVYSAIYTMHYMQCHICNALYADVTLHKLFFFVIRLGEAVILSTGTSIPAQ